MLCAACIGRLMKKNRGIFVFRFPSVGWLLKTVQRCRVVTDFFRNLSTHSSAQKRNGANRSDQAKPTYNTRITKPIQGAWRRDRAQNKVLCSKTLDFDKFNRIFSISQEREIFLRFKIVRKETQNFNHKDLRRIFVTFLIFWIENQIFHSYTSRRNSKIYADPYRE